MLGEHRLRGREVLRRQAEPLAHHLDDAPAAGVQDPLRDVVAPQPARLQERLHGRGHFPAHERGELAVEDDLQARVAEAEAHEVGRAGEEHALGGGEPGETGAARAGVIASGEHHRRAAVAEDRGGHDVGRGTVPALEGEARELEGDHEGAAVGVRVEEVARAGEGHDPAGAAALGDRQAGQARAHPQCVRDVGVDGRDHETRAGHADHEVDVRRPQLRPLQGPPREIDSGDAGDLDVPVVLALEVAGSEDFLDGHDARAPFHAGRLVDGKQPRRRGAALLLEPGAHPARHFVLVVSIGWEIALYREQRSHRTRPPCQPLPVTARTGRGSSPVTQQGRCHAGIAGRARQYWAASMRYRVQAYRGRKPLRAP